MLPRLAISFTRYLNYIIYYYNFIFSLRKKFNFITLPNINNWTIWTIFCVLRSIIVCQGKSLLSNFLEVISFFLSYGSVVGDSLVIRAKLMYIPPFFFVVCLHSVNIHPWGLHSVSSFVHLVDDKCDRPSLNNLYFLLSELHLWIQSQFSWPYSIHQRNKINNFHKTQCFKVLLKLSHP